MLWKRWQFRVQIMWIMVGIILFSYNTKVLYVRIIIILFFWKSIIQLYIYNIKCSIFIILLLFGQVLYFCIILFNYTFTLTLPNIFWQNDGITRNSVGLVTRRDKTNAHDERDDEKHFLSIIMESKPMHRSKFDVSRTFDIPEV